MLPNRDPTPEDVSYDLPPIPPGIVRATRVLIDQFPELLKKHDGMWAACDGSRVLFVGPSWDALYKRCLRRGLKPDEFVVNYIMPGALDDLHMPSYRDPG